MEKGDKVVIKPHHEVYIVEKVDEGFIWVNGRPYMRGQLDYAKTIAIVGHVDKGKRELENAVMRFIKGEK